MKEAMVFIVNHVWGFSRRQAVGHGERGTGNGYVSIGLSSIRLY